LGEVKVYNEIIKREEQEEHTTMTKNFENHEVISILTKEARRSMDHEHFEDAVLKLQRCLQLEEEPKSRSAILGELGYCFLRLGWFEEAIKVYTQLLKANPANNDSRFFLASAYASLKWTNDAIKELRTILSTDLNDVLAHHDLGLCYRDLGWMKESLEEMKIAHTKAMIYGNPEEKEVVKSSLVNLEQEIENDDGPNDALLFFILLTTMIKRLKSKIKKGKL
jgi:tetratricopeptide (TPR) repeat protein